ncbi:myelin-associated glycoprotein-like [Sinocyclocheilus grahami]|uniref:myelin-associated glycoprotein-like n=1 Tax=Sinocyclocheilus grahami TaxID=75366 RepID=UPI0007AD32CC|nr:PREDICTED: myelin-associated glycoprotein-like [Sinocyclocheilus grahami]
MMETLVTFLLTGSLIQGVFCGFSINLPLRVEALHGSCVFIPCTFDIDQQFNGYLTDRAKRIWFKGVTPVFVSSSPNTGLLKGEIFGTATQKNCTTRFDNVSQSHNGSYYFRLEDDKVRYNYREPTHSQVQIAVLGSPPKPTLRVFKDQQEVMKMVEVMEGSSVSLRCSTKIFCPSRPPSLRWSSSLNENVTEQQYQNQTELISDLNFTVSHRHHRVTFTCTATHQLQQPSTTQESRMLLVQYAPKNTSVRINPAGLVLEGGSVTLSCSSDANPAVNYTWYRDIERPLNPVQTGPNLTINNTDSTHIQTGPNLTINNTDPTDSGRYYCRAENKHGTQKTSALLDIQYAPKNTSAHVNPAGLVLEGGSVTLSCSSDANPAVNYTWYRDTERPLNLVQTGPNLTINNTDSTHSGQYYCRAENTHGTQNTSVLLDVQLTLSCSSDANPAVNYTWYRDTERPLNLVQTGPNLTINNTDPTDSGRYYCRAENKHGTQKTSALLDIQYAPKNTSAHVNPAGLVLEGGSVTLSCSSDANPAVNYTWYRDIERPLNPVQTGPNLTINNTDSTHSGQYYCRAENTHGTQNTSVLLDVQFAPNISSSCSRNSVMACVCEAHGNPCPTLEWRLSGHVLANSTEPSISEETLGSTGVKSILTIHQSLTDTDILQCFSANIYGSASQQFQAIPPPQKTMLLGAAVGVLLMMIVCIVMLCCERKRKEKPLETRQDDTSGLILTQAAIALDNDGQFVYANNGMLSSTAPSATESLHYSSIDFINAEPPPGEIRGIASLTSEYAAVQHRPAGDADAENNTSTSETEPKK